MICMKVHASSQGRIIALCDENLIGKILEDKRVYMDLDKHRHFYVGEKVASDAVEAALKDFSSANVVGKEAVQIVLRCGLASDDDVMGVGGVPFLQIYKL